MWNNSSLLQFLRIILWHDIWSISVSISVCLRRICILLLLSRMFYIFIYIYICYSHLPYSVVQVSCLLVFCLDDLLLNVGYWSILLLYRCLFFPSVVSILVYRFRYSDVGCISIYNYCTFLINWINIMQCYFCLLWQSLTKSLFCLI